LVITAYSEHIASDRWAVLLYAVPVLAFWWVSRAKWQGGTGRAAAVRLAGAADAFSAESRKREALRVAACGASGACVGLAL